MIYHQYPIFKESLDGRERVEFRDLEYGKILNHSQKEHIGAIGYLPRHDNSKIWRDCPSNVNKSYYYEVIENNVLLPVLLTESEFDEETRLIGRKLTKTGRRFEL